MDTELASFNQDLKASIDDLVKEEQAGGMCMISDADVESRGSYIKEAIASPTYKLTPISYHIDGNQAVEMGDEHSDETTSKGGLTAKKREILEKALSRLSETEKRKYGLKIFKDLDQYYIVMKMVAEGAILKGSEALKEKAPDLHESLVAGGKWTAKKINGGVISVDKTLSQFELYAGNKPHMKTVLAEISEEAPEFAQDIMLAAILKGAGEGAFKGAKKLSKNVKASLGKMPASTAATAAEGMTVSEAGAVKGTLKLADDVAGSGVKLADDLIKPEVGGAAAEIATSKIKFDFDSIKVKFSHLSDDVLQSNIRNAQSFFTRINKGSWIGDVDMSLLSLAEKNKIFFQVQNQLLDVRPRLIASGRDFRIADRYVRSRGGNIEDYAKMSSYQYNLKKGYTFETHWVENIKTGERFDFKIKHQEYR